MAKQQSDNRYGFVQIQQNVVLVAIALVVVLVVVVAAAAFLVVVDCIEL